MLATKSVTTNAGGQVPFAFDLKPAPRGRTITATASAFGVETSELSPPVTVKRL